MSKQIVYWVTRGHRIDIDEDSEISVEQYTEAIENNGLSENDIDLTLEAIEANSECVHFESCIVEVNDNNH
jgi:hypothetical protein